MKKRDTEVFFWIGIELVSLLSITFILIMFLALGSATASLIPSSSFGEMGINLPSAITTIPATNAEKGFFLTINSAGELFVGTKQIQISDLQSAISSYISQYGTPSEIKLAADKSVPYGTIVQIMDLVRRSGIPTVDLVVGQK